MQNTNIAAISMRKATSDDRAFIEELYFATQHPIIEELFGWRGDDVERDYFSQNFDADNTSIVLYGGEPAGWTTLQIRTDHVYLHSIYLHERRQNHGIGSVLIRMFLSDARGLGLPLRLSTAKINRARALYERLGFRCTGEDRTKVFMEAF